MVKQAQYIFIHDALMEYVTCGSTEFLVRELPEKLRILNTVDPDSGDSLLVAEFKVCLSEFSDLLWSRVTRNSRVVFFFMNAIFIGEFLYK